MNRRRIDERGSEGLAPSVANSHLRAASAQALPDLGHSVLAVVHEADPLPTPDDRVRFALLYLANLVGCAGFADYVERENQSFGPIPPLTEAVPAQYSKPCVEIVAWNCVPARPTQALANRSPSWSSPPLISWP